MKNIAIWMVLYMNDQCLREYYLCKKHYQRIIEYFNLPIKIYGILYGTDQEPTWSDGILYLPLNGRTMEDADSKTFFKYADFLKAETAVNADYHVRLTPSTYLNLPRINSIIQNGDFENTVLCGEMQRSTVDGLQHLYPRGNFVMYSEQHRKEMKEILEKTPLQVIAYEGCGSNDDHLLGTLLFKYLRLKYKSLGLHSTTDKTDRLTPDNIDNAYCIVYKDYFNTDQGYALFFLQWLIDYFEEKYSIKHTVTDRTFNGNWSLTNDTLKYWLSKIGL